MYEYIKNEYTYVFPRLLGPYKLLSIDGLLETGYWELRFCSLNTELFSFLRESDQRLLRGFAALVCSKSFLEIKEKFYYNI